jgi:hypothetical protein
MMNKQASRKSRALSICQEFTMMAYPRGRGIVLAIHRVWCRELEKRLRQVGWRFIREVEKGKFKILTAVDMYR